MIWNATLADVDKKYSRTLFEPKQDFIPQLQPLLIWQCLSLFWLCGLLAARFPLGATILALGIFFIDARLKSQARLCLAITLFILGFLAVHLLLPARPAYPAWAMSDNNKPKLTRIEGTVAKIEGLTDKRLRVTLKNVHSLEHKQATQLVGKMIWTWEAKKDHENLQLPIRPLPGQRVQISARIRSTESFNNWGTSNFGFYWQSQGVFWRIWSRGNYGNPQILDQPNPLANLRNKALSKLEHATFNFQTPANSIEYQAKAFLPSLLFGDKYHLDQESLNLMQASSLVHSLALSGQHLALVGLSAVIFLSCIYLFFPKALLILPHRKWLGILCLPLAALYLWLGNAPPSLMRAAIMLALALAFQWRMHVATLVDILLMTLLLITFYNPLAIFNLGLQLSVLCVASIALVLPLLRRIPNFFAESNSVFKLFFANALRRFLQIFIISLSIQIALTPIFLYYFDPAGPWFISNIFWLPILGFWVLPMAALGLFFACIWPSSAITEQILHIAAWPCEILLKILHAMQAENLFNFPIFLRPHWTSYLAWLALCIALAHWVGRLQINFKSVKFSPHKTLLLMALCLLFTGPIIRYISHWQQGIQIELLDVGQGQAVCITLSGGERILVDGAGSLSPRFDMGADIVIPSLIYNKSPRLLAVINTHPDLDHLRGLLAVLDKMQVGSFYHNGKKFSHTHSQKIKSLQMNNKLPTQAILSSDMVLALPSLWHNLTLETIHPPKVNEFSSNDASLVLRLVHNNALTKHGIVLLCADAEKKALKHILNAEKNIEASIIVVPHHGSNDALMPTFYDYTKAKIALVSTSTLKNLPHPEVRKALNERNIKLYSTSDHGAIRVTWHDNSNTYISNNTMLKPFINIKTQKHSVKLAGKSILR